MIDVIVWATWLLAAAAFGWVFLDFINTNLKNSEETLISSREGVDDLFGDASKSGGGH